MFQSVDVFINSLLPGLKLADLFLLWLFPNLGMKGLTPPSFQNSLSYLACPFPPFKWHHPHNILLPINFIKRHHIFLIDIRAQCKLLDCYPSTVYLFCQLQVNTYKINQYYIGCFCKKVRVIFVIHEKSVFSQNKTCIITPTETSVLLWFPQIKSHSFW